MSKRGNIEHYSVKVKYLDDSNQPLDPFWCGLLDNLRGAIAAITGALISEAMHSPGKAAMLVNQLVVIMRGFMGVLEAVLNVARK